MLEVESASHCGRMDNRSGRNVLGAEKDGL